VLKPCGDYNPKQRISVGRIWEALDILLSLIPATAQKRVKSLQWLWVGVPAATCELEPLPVAEIYVTSKNCELRATHKLYCFQGILSEQRNLIDMKWRKRYTPIGNEPLKVLTFLYHRLTACVRAPGLPAQPTQPEYRRA
jgi:hypothetical protein